MDATPGTEPLVAAAALPAPPVSHPTPRRRRVRRAWIDGALIGAVLALGLLQGARAALGGFVLEVPPAALAQSEAPSGDDALRGRFYRPPGSDAVRPPLRLEPHHWHPPSEARVALACEAGC